MSDYHFTTSVRMPLEQAKAATIAALRARGFGVLTEIDVQSTLKRKLGVDFRPYQILGACNPGMAYKALVAEDRIGTMLPCNVILQQKNGSTEISAVDPVASMRGIENPHLADIAAEVRAMLRQVIDELSELPEGAPNSRTKDEHDVDNANQSS